jgi:hypothetical protein
VTSPIYAQALLQTLRDSLEQYTAAFGPLRDPDQTREQHDEHRKR